MSEILQKIKDANTMKDMDDLRGDVLNEKTNESLQAWQKKYRGLKCFRKSADKGYRYDWKQGQTGESIQ